MKSKLFATICDTYKSRQVIFEPGREDLLNDGSDYDKRNKELFEKFGTMIYLLPYKNLKESIRLIYEDRGFDENTVNIMAEAFKKINKGYCLASQWFISIEGRTDQEVIKEISYVLI